MNIVMKLFFPTFLLLSFSAFSAPIYYAGEMDTTRWHTELRFDHCEIYTTIPGQGVKISFISEPEEDLSMKVFSSLYPTSKLEYSYAQAVNAPWNANQAQQEVQVTAKSIGSNKISFQQGVARLFRDISSGSWLQLNSVSDLGEKYLITIPVVAVQKEVNTFSQCVNQLPKISYQKVNNLSFQYLNGQRKPNQKQVGNLQTISDYIKKDPTVVKVLIDGHSDTSGNSSQNVLLSRLRADEVAQVLINNQITPDIITIRGHGGRYPVASNDTAEGREKNRRVQIRLVKVNQNEQNKS